MFGLNTVLGQCEAINKGVAFQILHSETNFVKGFRKHPQRKILIKGLMDVLLDVNVIKLMGQKQWQDLLNATFFNVAMKKGL